MLRQCYVFQAGLSDLMGISKITANNKIHGFIMVLCFHMMSSLDHRLDHFSPAKLLWLSLSLWMQTCYIMNETSGHEAYPMQNVIFLLPCVTRLQVLISYTHGQRTTEADFMHHQDHTSVSFIPAEQYMCTSHCSVSEITGNASQHISLMPKINFCCITSSSDW